VLNQLRDDLPEQRFPVSTSAAVEKLIEKIEAARATDGSWFGKPPAPGEEGERENAVVIDEIHHAIFHCEQEGVPEDVIESMLLRSWIRMLVFNEHEDERVFHILDKYWEHCAYTQSRFTPPFRSAWRGIPASASSEGHAVRIFRLVLSISPHPFCLPVGRAAFGGWLSGP
jgi:hypothetical protein